MMRDRYISLKIKQEKHIPAFRNVSDLINCMDNVCYLIPVLLRGAPRLFFFRGALPSIFVSIQVRLRLVFKMETKSVRMHG
jgi:hypothetical protein